jgi:hypothetical protein
MSDGPSLTTLREIMSHEDVRRLYAKVLSPNDNSKNQPYFGDEDISGDIREGHQKKPYTASVCPPL